MITEYSTLSEIAVIFEINNRDISLFIRSDSEMIEFDDGVMVLTKVIVRNEGGSSAEYGFGEFCGKLKGRIFGVLFLMISGLVRLVDNDETKVFDGRKQRRAWADNDLRLVGD